MAEILLFHHAQGQTDGFNAFAERLRDAGHVVHTPDLYDGNTFTTLDDGIGYAKQVGFGALLDRGALFFYSCLPVSEFGSWPEGVPIQIHAMEGDEWFEEDAPAARELVDTVEQAELFLYPGSAHLFADSSLDDYDARAASLLEERALAFLKSVG
jgi:dienelactone hydrolase